MTTPICNLHISWIGLQDERIPEICILKLQAEVVLCPLTSVQCQMFVITAALLKEAPPILLRSSRHPVFFLVLETQCLCSSEVSTDQVPPNSRF